MGATKQCNKLRGRLGLSLRTYGKCTKTDTLCFKSGYATIVSMGPESFYARAQ